MKPAGRAFNLPNSITALRIMLIPAFIITLEYKRYDLALYLFILASLSDLVDGIVARKANQKTVLGTFLDPIADKFMLVASFVFFTLFGWIPAWLTIIIISRDIIIVTGCFLIYLINHSLKIEPLVSGKIAIALQYVLIWFVLLDINIGLYAGAKGPLMLAVALMTVFSGLVYIQRGLKLTSGK